MGFSLKGIGSVARFGQKLGASALKMGQKAVHQAEAVGEGISKALPSVEKVAKSVSKVAKAAAPYAAMVSPVAAKAISLVGSGADIVASTAAKGKAAEKGIRGGVEAVKAGNVEGGIKKIGEAGAALGKGLKQEGMASKALMNRR